MSRPRPRGLRPIRGGRRPYPGRPVRGGGRGPIRGGGRGPGPVRGGGRPVRTPVRPTPPRPGGRRRRPMKKRGCP